MMWLPQEQERQQATGVICRVWGVLGAGGCSQEEAKLEEDQPSGYQDRDEEWACLVLQLQQM